jgi:hypothetical protein
MKLRKFDACPNHCILYQVISSRKARRPWIIGNLTPALTTRGKDTRKALSRKEEMRQ